MKVGYRELFERNEYAGNRAKEPLKGLVVEITGLDAKDRVVQLICQTFEELRRHADFDAKSAGGKRAPEPEEIEEQDTSDERADERDFGLSLSYTINLVLPKSDDLAVFNAIFRALRDNLLRR